MKRAPEPLCLLHKGNRKEGPAIRKQPGPWVKTLDPQVAQGHLGRSYSFIPVILRGLQSEISMPPDQRLHSQEESSFHSGA